MKIDNFLARLDVLMAVLAFPAAHVLRRIRKIRIERLPLTRRLLQRIGVFPIINHYYDPLPDPAKLRQSSGSVRSLPAIDFNVAEQLAMLRRFAYHEELRAFPLKRRGELEFYYQNTFFEAGDAEYLYSMIRTVKPARFVEIGCGKSSLMAAAAIRRNGEDDPSYACRQVCIDPRHNPWLERLSTEVVRQPVEDADPDLFRGLGRNDILFIDSSHIIRPGGDVLFEYFEILPSLGSGAFVHIHDFFSPRDYPVKFSLDRMMLWNEQYLVEAFLSYNRDFRVVGALNLLFHDHREALEAAFPMLAPEHRERGVMPSSLWLVRN